MAAKHALSNKDNSVAIFFFEKSLDINKVDEKPNQEIAKELCILYLLEGYIEKCVSIGKKIEKIFPFLKITYFEKIVRRKFRYLPSPSHLDEIEFIMSSSTHRTKLEPDPCPFFEILISLRESEYKALHQLPADVSLKLSCQVK